MIKPLICVIVTSRPSANGYKKDQFDIFSDCVIWYKRLKACCLCIQHIILGRTKIYWRVVHASSVLHGLNCISMAFMVINFMGLIVIS